MVPELARRYPQLELVIEERVTDDVTDRIRHDVLDAGLLATPVGGAEWHEQLLFREPFVGYVSPTHRLAARSTIAPGDLSLDDLWLLAEGHCFRMQAVQLCRERATSRRRSAAACTTGARFESGNLETLKRLVEGGAGMTLLPALAAAELRTAQQRALVRPFAAPAPSRDIRLVRRRAHLKQHLIDAVMEVLFATLPAEVEPLTQGRARRRAASPGSAAPPRGARRGGRASG